ncbi:MULTISPECIES: tripartite tricarboxylate transporter substrate binding protein [unclassified Hydrogenophaga]|uniref:Bug family tripartite tricarboxylate transporter substrate binding protein n=1 Tax=unclassified Hydrogenophaga TaxID=2610897 RepID=UPI0009F6B7F7|nr:MULTISPECIES: tripartite tricarboxylate transporter substrate binding protein [unclassified Hydrogenophaga]MBN9369896.1 tripartite tricarboxylate transporter substrate binding protein [Hydrogenophaga sp.]WQB82868.1 tripartite tricarboxylate transporter substrate binding protein [Hydrogenophaga sp. SNF1]
MNPISRRRLLAAACLLSTLGSAAAQDWPSRPVRMIVPVGAGSAPDVIARIVGERLANAWGQGVVVDNRPGAGGIPGMSALVRSAPDGYTIGFVPAAMGTITPLVFKNPQFNPDTDLAPVATVGISPLMLAVPASSGIRSMADLAQHAKAHPGKVNFAAPQLNSLPHLAGEMVSKAGGMGLFTVPYRTPPDAVAAVLAGDAVLTVDGVPGLLEHVKSGRLRAVGVTSAQRLPGIDAPPVADTYPGYEAIGWFQIIAPAGTPPGVIERINADVNRITASSEVTRRLADMGVYPRQDSVSAAHAFFVQQQGAMRRLVTALGVQPQ